MLATIAEEPPTFQQTEDEIEPVEVAGELDYGESTIFAQCG